VGTERTQRPEPAERVEVTTVAARRTFLLRAFTVALGVFTVVHNAILGTFELVSAENLTVAVAILAIARPSAKSLLALLAADLVSTAIKYPEVYNHSVLVAVIALIVLTWAAWHALHRRGDFGEDQLYAAVAPAIRTTVLVAYGFAAFAKLNSGFFERDTSCAVKIYNDVVDVIAVLPRTSLINGPLIYGTVAVEIAIPILLAMRRTRIAGLAVGAVFHLVLVTAGHSPFTTAAFAFYVGFFLPEDTLDRLRELGRRHRRAAGLVTAGRSAISSTWTVLLVLVAWIAVSVTSVTDPSGRRSPRVIDALEPAVLVYGFVLIAVAAAALCVCDRPVYSRGMLRFAHPGWLVGPLLVVVVGASPYLGLKTRSSFTMYSNLRTEGTAWNHLVVPEGVQVFSFQDDLVRVIRSDDPELAEIATVGDEMVWYEFAEHRRARPSYSVVFERAGERVHLLAGDPLGSFDAPPHALSRVLAFRPVSTTGRCQH
jgi:hypothetical protein